MYFYRIEVYHSFGEPTYMIMSHKYYFDNYQLNIIVQEAFDECIEKYSNKTSLDEGEEPCRMAVEIIFEDYLPAQLQNHGFTNVKIDGTCSIMDGELFLDDGAINPVLKKRYLDKALPPCKKCIRDECIVPNIRKDNSLPITLTVETRGYNLNEKETENNNEDDFYIKIIKFYFNNSKKSFEDMKIASDATTIIFDNNDLNDFWIEYGTSEKEIHEGDILCVFDMESDEKKAKNLLINYGFILQKGKNGFWITGVKE